MSKFIVCPTCEGKGRIDHPAFSNGVDPNLMDDRDFEDDYFAGKYDIKCTECKGLRVVDTQSKESVAYCCGKRMREYSEQEYPGAFIHRWRECQNEDCEESE